MANAKYCLFLVVPQSYDSVTTGIELGWLLVTQHQDVVCLVVSTLASIHPVVDTDAGAFCVSDHILQTIKFGTRTETPLLLDQDAINTSLQRPEAVLCRYGLSCLVSKENSHLLPLISLRARKLHKG